MFSYSCNYLINFLPTSSTSRFLCSVFSLFCIISYFWTSSLLLLPCPSMGQWHIFNYWTAPAGFRSMTGIQIRTNGFSVSSNSSYTENKKHFCKVISCRVRRWPPRHNVAKYTLCWNQIKNRKNAPIEFRKKKSENEKLKFVLKDQKTLRNSISRRVGNAKNTTSHMLKQASKTAFLQVDENQKKRWPLNRIMNLILSVFNFD